MTADAFAAHDEGRVRAVEVRGSDYMGAGVGDGAHVPRVAPRALGKAVRVFGSPDQPHSWTDVRDMGRALAAVATDERAWGRIWHAPTNPPRTQREAVADVCRAAGKEPVKVRAYPRLMLSLGGRMNAMLRELQETAYQFERPYVLDSSAITRELGLAPTRGTRCAGGPRASPGPSSPGRPDPLRYGDARDTGTSGPHRRCGVGQEHGLGDPARPRGGGGRRRPARPRGGRARHRGARGDRGGLRAGRAHRLR